MQVTRMQENMRLSNKCTEKLTSGGLCASYPTSALSKALGMSNLVDGNSDFLAQSCSARIEGNASQVHDTSSDDELTNLGWLQDNDLLKNMSFTQSKSVVNTTAVKTNAEPENESKDSALAALPYDPYLHSDNKPPYSFSTLIFMAIDQAEGKKLSVKEIYEWIWENFPYYQNAQTGWKNSVRHNLSLNKCFRKVEKDKEGGHGKGSLWTVDPDYRPTLLDSVLKSSHSQLGAHISPPFVTLRSINSSTAKAVNDDYLSDIEVATALINMKHSSQCFGSTDEKPIPLPMRSSSPVERVPSSTSLDHSYSRCKRGTDNGNCGSNGDSGMYDGYDTDDTEPFGVEDGDECARKVNGAEALMRLAHTASRCEMEGVDYMINAHVVDSCGTTSERGSMEDLRIDETELETSMKSVNSDAMDDSGISTTEKVEEDETPCWVENRPPEHDAWSAAVCYKQGVLSHSTIATNYFTTGVAF